MASEQVLMVQIVTALTEFTPRDLTAASDWRISYAAGEILPPAEHLSLKIEWEATVVKAVDLIQQIQGAKGILSWCITKPHPKQEHEQLAQAREEKSKLEWALNHSDMLLQAEKENISRLEQRLSEQMEKSGQDALRMLEENGHMRALLEEIEYIVAHDSDFAAIAEWRKKYLAFRLQHKGAA